MLIFNNTDTKVAYGLESPSCADCGQLAPGEYADWKSYSQYSDVTVNFVPMSDTGFVLKTEGNKIVRISLTATDH